MKNVTTLRGGIFLTHTVDLCMTVCICYAEAPGWNEMSATLWQLNVFILTCSFSSQLASASEHLVSYLDRSDKQVVTTTYKDLHTLVDHVAESGFFDEVSRVSAEPDTEAEGAGQESADVEANAETEDVAVESGMSSVYCCFFSYLQFVYGPESCKIVRIHFEVGYPIKAPVKRLDWQITPVWYVICHKTLNSAVSPGGAVNSWISVWTSYLQ